jgi:hypothetical protein
LTSGGFATWPLLKQLLYGVRQKNLTVFNITGLKNRQVFQPHPVSLDAGRFILGVYKI